MYITVFLDCHGGNHIDSICRYSAARQNWNRRLAEAVFVRYILNHKAEELITRSERMSVKIRLKRTGTRNNHCFRIVVMDVRCSRDGKAIEEIGLYDPRHKNENIDMERYAYWRQVGAQPSETVELIVKRAEEGRKLGEKAKSPRLNKKAKARLEEEKKAAEKAAAEVAGAADASAK